MLRQHKIIKKTAADNNKNKFNFA